jgi:hypothetical protein
VSRYDEKKQLKCSFCGKAQEQVKRLVAGPGVYICDECIELCSEIIGEEFEDTSVDIQMDEIPKPSRASSIEFDRISKNDCWQPSSPSEPNMTPGRSLTRSAPFKADMLSFP